MPIEQFIAALQADGWQVVRKSAGQPSVLHLRRGDVAHRLRVYIWNVTAGGPKGIRPRGEYRIQKMVHGPLTIDRRARTLLLGRYRRKGVFVSWDPTVHQSAAYSASVQVPVRRLDEAASRGIAVHQRATPHEMVILFTPETISGFLQGLERLPLTTQDPEEAAVLVKAASKTGIRPKDLRGMTRKRQLLATTASRWSRDASFRHRVLWAYRHRCAFCGMQLGLVQAAHIVGVTVRGSTDETTNGLSLCPTCHSAFDSGLAGLLEDGRVVINQDKVRALRDAGLLVGLEPWSRLLRRRVLAPRRRNLRPAAKFIRRRLALIPGTWLQPKEIPV